VIDRRPRKPVSAQTGKIDGNMEMPVELDLIRNALRATGGVPQANSSNDTMWKKIQPNVNHSNSRL
jgi:hypothetical protein